MIKAGDFVFYLGNSGSIVSNALVVSIDEDTATILIEPSFTLGKVEINELYEDSCNTRKQDFVHMFKEEYKKAKEHLNTLDDAKSIMDFFC